MLLIQVRKTYSKLDDARNVARERALPDRNCSNSTLKILLLLTLFFLLTFTIKKRNTKKKDHDIHSNFLNFSRVKKKIKTKGGKRVRKNEIQW